MILCKILGHQKSQHIDIVYGSLCRTHIVCTRCKATIAFRKSTVEEEEEYHPDGDLDCASNFSTSPYKIS